jgi:hypothetical protein
MAAHTRIPEAGLDILGCGSFLQKKLSPVIKNKDMGNPVDQAGVAVTLTARSLPDYPVLFIDDLEYFFAQSFISCQKRGFFH